MNKLKERKQKLDMWAVQHGEFHDETLQAEFLKCFNRFPFLMLTGDDQSFYGAAGAKTIKEAVDMCLEAPYKDNRWTALRFFNNEWQQGKLQRVWGMVVDFEWSRYE